MKIRPNISHTKLRHKFTAIGVLSFFFIGVLAAEFEKNDIVELVQTVSGRSFSDFRASVKNILSTISKKTKLQIQEKKRMPSGNWGFKVKVLEGPQKNKEYWVYYNYKKPSMKLYEKEKITTPEKATHAVTINNTGAIDTTIVNRSSSLSPTASSKKQTQALSSHNIKRENLENWNEYTSNILLKIAETRKYTQTNKAPTATEKPEWSFKKDTLTYTSGTKPNISSYAEKTSVENCPPIDNRNAILGAPRDQDSIGWCFAYAAADLLSHALGVKISAIDTALAYFQTAEGKRSLPAKNDIIPIVDNVKYKTLEGGNIIPSIEALQSIGGACKEIDLPSDDYSATYAAIVKGYKINKQDPDKAFNLENYGKYYLYGKILNPLNLLNKIEYYKIESEKNKNANELCEIIPEVKTLFPNLDLGTILGAMQGSKNSGDSVDWLQYFNCKEKRVPFPSNLKIHRVFAEENLKHALLKDIDEQLNKGNIIGITYDLHMLPLSEEAKKINPNVPHASTIVAREFKNGSCQYLVRNSWGTSCGMYTDDEDSGNSPCDKGNLWISETKLKKELQEIQFLSKTAVP